MGKLKCYAMVFGAVLGVIAAFGITLTGLSFLSVIAIGAWVRFFEGLFGMKPFESCAMDFASGAILIVPVLALICSAVYIYDTGCCKDKKPKVKSSKRKSK